MSANRESLVIGARYKCLMCNTGISPPFQTGQQGLPKNADDGFKSFLNYIKVDKLNFNLRLTSQSNPEPIQVDLTKEMNNVALSLCGTCRKQANEFKADLDLLQRTQSGIDLFVRATELELLDRPSGDLMSVLRYGEGDMLQNVLHESAAEALRNQMLLKCKLMFQKRLSQQRQLPFVGNETRPVYVALAGPSSIPSNEVLMGMMGSRQMGFVKHEGQLLDLGVTTATASNTLSNAVPSCGSSRMIGSTGECRQNGSNATTCKNSGNEPEISGGHTSDNVIRNPPSSPLVSPSDVNQLPTASSSHQEAPDVRMGTSEKLAQKYKWKQRGPGDPRCRWGSKKRAQKPYTCPTRRSERLLAAAGQASTASAASNAADSNTAAESGSNLNIGGCTARRQFPQCSVL